MAKSIPTAAEYAHHDGGRQASGMSEKLDCVVRAISVAMEEPYADVHAALKRAGRLDGCRTKLRVFHAVAGQPTVSYPRGSAPTYAAWLRDHLTGRWIVRVAGHAFAVIDGVQHDNSMRYHKPRARVLDTWCVEGRP